jgi:NodT family efflux transporter outer membrane factor (OMF) lipoprotein
MQDMNQNKRPSSTPAAATALPAAAPFLSLPGLLVALGLAMLGGCAADPALGPKEKLPSNEEAAAHLGLARDASQAPALPSASWWTAYKDPELDRWVAKGLADSPSVHEAAARVAQARAAYAQAHAAQGPMVGFGADGNWQRISSNGIFPPPIAGMVGTIWDAGFNASFDFDFFGRLAARTEGARLSAEAQAANRELVRVKLAGAIGHAYFSLAHAQQVQRILVELEGSRSQFLELVKRRVQGGFDTQVDRRIAEVPVPQIRVEIERANEEIALARHNLALLAGQAPQAADAVDAHLPEGAALVPPSALPLDLLARRADIVGARTRAMAALREVDAARAEYYPNVNLSALVGLDALGASNFLKGTSRTWQVEPAIHLPIFDSGLLDANLNAASAQTDEAIAAYNAAVLQAAGEAADALTSIAAVQRQRERQDEATRAAQAASDLAQVRYQAGLGNLLAVLGAQANVLTQRRAEADLAARAAALNVNLALALGGGFGAAPEQRDAPAAAGGGTR